MIRTIRKIGDSQGLLLDDELLELTDLKMGDEVNVEVHAGGIITLTPILPRPSKSKISRVIKSTLNEYSGTMRKLA